MRLLFRFTFFLLFNFVLLFIAGTFIPGFEISHNPVNLMIAAGIFTLINF